MVLNMAHQTYHMFRVVDERGAILTTLTKRTQVLGNRPMTLETCHVSLGNLHMC